jgi:protein TonB
VKRSGVLPALLLALLCHGLLLQLPVPGKDVQPPRLTGRQAIHISLAPALSRENRSGQQRVQAEKNHTAEPAPFVEKETPNPPDRKRKKTDQPSPQNLIPPRIRPTARKKRLPRQAKTASADRHQNIEQQASAGDEQTAPAFSSNTGPTSPSPAPAKAAPLYKTNPKPPYPRLARRRGWQGTVILKVQVSTEGQVHQVGIHTSSGYPLLDRTAAKTVKGWRFQPGTRGGQPVSMEVLVPVHFTLQ